MKIKKITLVVLFGLFNVSLAYANCGPLPGGIGWLSKAKIGNYYNYYLKRIEIVRFLLLMTHQNLNGCAFVLLPPQIGGRLC